MRFVQKMGYNVQSLTNIKHGPDQLVVDLKYKQKIIKGEHGKINSDPVPILAS